MFSMSWKLIIKYHLEMNWSLQRVKTMLFANSVLDIVPLMNVLCSTEYSHIEGARLWLLLSHSLVHQQYCFGETSSALKADAAMCFCLPYHLTSHPTPIYTHCHEKLSFHFLVTVFTGARNCMWQKTRDAHSPGGAAFVGALDLFCFQ